MEMGFSFLVSNPFMLSKFIYLMFDKMPQRVEFVTCCAIYLTNWVYVKFSSPTWFKIYICVVSLDNFVRMERIVWLSFCKRKIKMGIGVYWQLILVFLVMVFVSFRTSHVYENLIIVDGYRYFNYDFLLTFFFSFSFSLKFTFLLIIWSNFNYKTITFSLTMLYLYLQCPINYKNKQCPIISIGNKQFATFTNVVNFDINFKFQFDKFKW